MRFNLNVVMGTSLPESITLSLKWGKKIQPITYENTSVFSLKCLSYRHLIVNYKKLDRMDEEKFGKEFEGGAPPNDLGVAGVGSLEGAMVVTLSPSKEP